MSENGQDSAIEERLNEIRLEAEAYASQGLPVPVEISEEYSRLEQLLAEYLESK